MSSWSFCTCQKCGSNSSRVESWSIAGVHAALCNDCFSDIARKVDGSTEHRAFLQAENEVQRLLYTASSTHPPSDLKDAIVFATAAKVAALLERFDFARKLIPRADKVKLPEEAP